MNRVYLHWGKGNINRSGQRRSKRAGVNVSTNGDCFRFVSGTIVNDVCLFFLQGRLLCLARWWRGQRRRGGRRAGSCPGRVLCRGETAGSRGWGGGSGDRRPRTRGRGSKARLQDAGRVDDRRGGPHRWDDQRRTTRPGHR